MLEWDCTNCYISCNTGRKGVKELAKANCSSFSKKVTLGYLQGQPIFIVFKKKILYTYIDFGIQIKIIWLFLEMIVYDIYDDYIYHGV